MTKKKKNIKYKIGNVITNYNIVYYIYRSMLTKIINYIIYNV